MNEADFQPASMVTTQTQVLPWACMSKPVGLGCFGFRTSSFFGYLGAWVIRHFSAPATGGEICPMLLSKMIYRKDCLVPSRL
jgi:hypothetical protein